ncbi:MAG: Mov34/MPN/PAD-1 family protein [Promethearchaeota archaeon]
MKLINVFYIPEIFVNIIKKQALSSENEIYGWLIGYQKDKIPNVLAIMECKQFEQQTLISAIPHAQEFQEISSILPQGIGPIGIYHSHPFSSEIFHSHTDDATLISLSNQFPNCVSIVTNGKDINYYQMGKKSKITKINVKYIEPEIPKFLLFSLDETLLIKISKSILNNIEDAKSLKVRIFNRISNFLENFWKDLELFTKNSKISENEIIRKYLVNKLRADPIQLKISVEKRTKNEIQICINNNYQSNLKTDSLDNNYEFLKLDLIAKVPIYISSDNKSFADINHLIKTELISNNLLQKIYNSVIDFENRKIITPEDYYLNFFGFYIKILCFNTKELNKNGFSKRIFELINKIVALLGSFTNIELSDKIKTQIQTLLKGINKICKKFSWYLVEKKNIELLEKNLINFNKKLLT